MSLESSYKLYKDVPNQAIVAEIVTNVKMLYGDNDQLYPSLRPYGDQIQAVHRAALILERKLMEEGETKNEK